MVLLYLLVAFFFVACLVRKNNRGIFFLFFAFLLILFAGRTDGADYLNYKLNYSYVQNFSWSGWEPLYQIAILLLKRLNIDYDAFLFLYGLVGLALISRTYYKYSNNYNAMLLLYFIYPFALDAAQIRSFMATAIVFYFIPYLMEDDKKSMVKFFMGVILAFGVHYSAVFYLLLFLIKVIDKKHMPIICFSLSLGLFVFIKNINRFVAFFPEIIVRKINYLSGELKWYSMVIIFIYLIGTQLFMSWINKHNCSPMFRLNIGITKINYIMLILYPLFIIDLSFFRIQRIAAMLNYLVIYNFQSNDANRVKIVRFFGVMYALVSFSIFIAYSNWELVVQALFESNKWFGVLR